MPHEIHPDRNPPDPRATLAEITRLQSILAHRDASRNFFVEGVRNVVEAIENGFRIETLLVSDQLLTVPIARKLARQRRRSGVPTLPVAPEAFRQVSGRPCLRRRRHRRPEVVAAARHLAAGRPLLGRARGRPLAGQLHRSAPRRPSARRVHPDRAADRPLRPRGRPRLDGAPFWQAFIRTSDRSLRNWLLYRHRCLAVGALPDGPVELHRFRFPRAVYPRLGRGSRGAHAAPARNPGAGPRPHPDGRRGRLPEPRRGGEPAPVRGLSRGPPWRGRSS